MALQPIRAEQLLWLRPNGGKSTADEVLKLLSEGCLDPTTLLDLPDASVVQADQLPELITYGQSDLPPTIPDIASPPPISADYPQSGPDSSQSTHASVQRWKEPHEDCWNAARRKRDSRKVVTVCVIVMIVRLAYSPYTK